MTFNLDKEDLYNETNENNNILFDDDLFNYNSNLNIFENSYDYIPLIQQDFNSLLPLQQQSINDFPENIINLEKDISASNDKLEDYPEIKVECKTKADKILHVTLPSTKEKIFKTKKFKNFIGRKSKNSLYNKEKPHTKKSKDNIITTIKRKLINYSLEFINSLIKKSKNDEINKIKLLKIDNTSSIVYNKEKSLDLLNLTLKDLLSGTLSKKYKLLDENYNKININLIIENKENDLINAFNITLREILHIYCDDNKNGFFEDLKRLKDDKNNFKSKNEEKSYIELYEKTAKNFEEIINGIIPKKK